MSKTEHGAPGCMSSCVFWRSLVKSLASVADQLHDLQWRVIPVQSIVLEEPLKQDGVRRPYKKRNSMAGFVYAVCKLDDLSSVKIGFTTQNPHEYCRAYGRTLTPLHILAIEPFSKARLGEANVFHILSAQRVHEKHEIFDLSSDRGLQDLKQALQQAAALDKLAGLVVPEVPKKEDIEANDEKQRRKKRQDKLEAKHKRQQRKLEKAKADRRRIRKDKALWNLAASVHKRKSREFALVSAIQEFLNDRCVLEPHTKTNASHLLREFNSQSGLTAKQKEFREILATKGFKYLTCFSRYEGIRLLTGDIK